MGELIPDPELERIIAEMNRDTADVEAAAPSGFDPNFGGQDLRDVLCGGPLEALLGEMVRREASDLLLVPGAEPIVRVHGLLQRLALPVLDRDQVRELFAPHLGRRALLQLDESGSTDFSLRLEAESGSGSWRFRVNLLRQAGGLAAAVRGLPRRIPSLSELGLPDELRALAEHSSGLVLVCGPTGSGKTTTLAAMLHSLNKHSFRHVVTIEDPVEYEHRDECSVFEQVEIGTDAPAFAAALRAALRRDPDVILVGEMRDLETIATALTAAETGHLVLSTLHTGDSAQAVHRIIDVFPSSQQAQIRQQLALSLRAVACQQLIPVADGRGRVVAVELLIATYAIRNHIRNGHTDRLYNELVAGQSLGMCTMESALAGLVRSGRIAADEALSRSSRPEELRRML